MRDFLAARFVLNGWRREREPNVNTTPTPHVLPRRLRLAQRRIAVAAGAVLLGATAFGFWTNRVASGVVVSGHGEHLLHALRREHPVDRPYDAARLAPMLERLAPEGLRCVTVFDTRLTITARAGACTLSAASASAALRDFRPGAARPVGDHYYAVHRLPGPGLGPPESDGPPPPADGPHRWPFLIEFDVPPARALDMGAWVSLGAGLLAIAALATATWLNQRLGAETEGLEQALGRERHLATLGEMSAVLAHELRNPIASIKGHAQLMIEQTGQGSPAAERSAILVREAVRLENLCEQLLSFVRANRVEPVASDPAKILRAAAAAVDERRIEVHTDGAPPAWPLDPFRMHQALVNLLENALDASSGESLTRACARVEAGALVFEVRDVGPGVPAAEHERIFEPFHTTRVRGTGLGLAITRRIVELHGGRVGVRNHPDGGAVFRIELPQG